VAGGRASGARADLATAQKRSDQEALSVPSPNQPITLAFVGYATAAMADRASAFEDEVLELLDGHGARLLYRGRRIDHRDESLPLEIQLLSFPDRKALEAYLADDRRQRLLAKYGDVFTRKCAVEIETVEPREWGSASAAQRDTSKS
jgi:uncharacterized protein (DUF1330 family)